MNGGLPLSVGVPAPPLGALSDGLPYVNGGLPLSVGVPAPPFFELSVISRFGSDELAVSAYVNPEFRTELLSLLLGSKLCTKSSIPLEG